MDFQREATRLMNELADYVKSSSSTWTMTVVIYLSSAAVYALLDIAQAIRQSR